MFLILHEKNVSAAFLLEGKISPKLFVDFIMQKISMFNYSLLVGVIAK